MRLAETTDQRDEVVLVPTLAVHVLKGAAVGVEPKQHRVVVDSALREERGSVLLFVGLGDELELWFCIEFCASDTQPVADRVNEADVLLDVVEVTGFVDDNVVEEIEIAQ